MHVKIMKRVFLVATAVVCITTMIPSTARALDIGVGATCWYSWWKFSSEAEDMKFDPGPLYGPVLSLGFSKDWSLTSIFLYGKFNSSTDSGPPDLKRFDSDTALNYNINKWLKVFAGGKVMGFDYDGGVNRALGPAVGFGITAPLGKNFFALFNASALYLWGDQEDVSFIEYGYNGTVSLAYYIQSASTVVTAGFRYQFVTLSYENEDHFNDSDLYFYGVIVSVVYSFNI